MRLSHQIPPIAMLHCVSDEIGGVLENWCISHKAFSRLLDHLEKQHYHTTNFFEIVENSRSLRRSSPEVIISFDDCYKHLFDFAIPELTKRNMTAVFYMPAAHIGGYNKWDVEKGATQLDLMNETDLKELVHLGFEVGSHSYHHIELKDLPVEKIEEEVRSSKAAIEAITQKKVYSFSYPYGSVPASYEKVLKETGYKYGVSIYQSFETPLALRRFGIYEKDTDESLERKLSQRYKWFRKMYDKVKKY